MLVTNYNYAHKIVEGNKSLSWDGWNIVEFKPNSDAYFMNEGVFKDSMWGIKKVFPITENGWEIPKKYVR